MSQRYFMDLAYRGTDWVGWQIQPNGPSIQGTLSEALGLLLKEECMPVGAGRTDAGVHATQYTAHFDVSTAVPSTDELLYKLNRFLPDSIAVLAIRPVAERMHARFSCTSRMYCYRIARVKNPFTVQGAWELRRPMEWEKLQEATLLVKGEHDFSAFARSGASHTSPLCTVTEAYWEKSDQEWVLHIRANRFLRNMVRALVGTLVEVAEGGRSVDSFSHLLQGGTRTLSGQSAPACGLYFEGAVYPEEA